MKPSKRGGESMNADRISKLPGVLIVHILSLLPTKSAVATSVLSKQWKFHWKMMPKLEFDSCDHKGELGTFSNNVCKSLLSHKASVLESLHLSFSLDRCDASDIGMWIGIAYAQHVRKLVLDVESTMRGSFTLPRILFNCEILETLTLKGIGFPFLPSQVCLESLKTLHLPSSLVIDQASFLKLLLGCPNLEDLLVHTPKSGSAGTFTIAVPSLQRLSICKNDYFGSCGYMINAPSLKFLKIEGNASPRFSVAIEDVTNLVEANIIENVSPIVNRNYYENSSPMITENLLRSLTSVKRLSLELLPLKIKFPTGIIFYQLVHLELYTSREAWWNLLTFMLCDSPNLRVLKLINSSQNHWRKSFKSSGNWNHPEKFPKCLLCHLETFMWEGFNKWLIQEEKKSGEIHSNECISFEESNFLLKRHEF